MPTDPVSPSPGPEAFGSPVNPASNGEGEAPAPSRTLPRVIAVANQKGGVGKTTTTINLGACLAELGLRTLIIDLDPQGNASTGLGIENRGLETSMYHVLMHDVPLENCIEPTDVRNLFVAPARLDLAGAEIELVPAFSRETRLKRAIEAVLDDYDYVLIDCPPSLGLLTVNGLAAAREVLVPIQCEYYALEGPRPAAAQRRPRPTQPQSDAGGQHDRVRDVRRPRPSSPIRSSRRSATTSATRCCGRWSRARCGCPRRRRSASRSSRSTPTSRGAIAYRDVAKEVHDGSLSGLGKGLSSLIPRPT